MLEEVLKHSPLAVLHSDLSQEIRSEVELRPTRKEVHARSPFPFLAVQLFFLLLEDMFTCSARRSKNNCFSIKKKYILVAGSKDQSFLYKSFETLLL